MVRYSPRFGGASAHPRAKIVAMRGHRAVAHEERHVRAAPPDTIGPVTTLAFAALAVTVAISAFIQGATGMGFAMIAAPGVALLDPGLIPVLLLGIMLPLLGCMAWRGRSAIDWRGVKWISVRRFAGTFGGLWILLVVSAPALNLIIGWATVLAVAAALLAPAFHPNRSALASVGVITGVTETATGVGGPPLALAYQHGPGAQLRTTIATCFLIGEVVSLAVLGVSGQIAPGTLVLSAWLLPCVVLGFSALAGIAVIIGV